jgi:hypothetical protein
VKYPSGAHAQIFPEYVCAGHVPYTYYGRPFPYPKTPYYHSPYYQDYYYHYPAYYPAYEPFVYNTKPEIVNIDDLESKNVHCVQPANRISAENSVKPIIACEIYPHPLTHDSFQNTDCKKMESVNRPNFYNQLPPFRENSPFDSRLQDADEYRPASNCASSTAISSPVKESGYRSKREYESGSYSKTSRINEKYYPNNTLYQDSVTVPFASSYPPNIYKNRAFSLDTTEYRVFDECNNGKESLLPTQSRRSSPVESQLHQQGYMQKIPPIQVKKEGSVCESTSSMADHPRRKLPRIETLDCFRRNQNDMRSASSNIAPYSISSAGQDVNESDKTAACPL